MHCWDFNLICCDEWHDGNSKYTYCRTLNKDKDMQGQGQGLDLQGQGRGLTSLH